MGAVDQAKRRVQRQRRPDAIAQHATERQGECPPNSRPAVESMG